MRRRTHVIDGPSVRVGSERRGEAERVAADGPRVVTAITESAEPSAKYRRGTRARTATNVAIGGGRARSRTLASVVGVAVAVAASREVHPPSEGDRKGG